MPSMPRSEMYKSTMLAAGGVLVIGVLILLAEPTKRPIGAILAVLGVLVLFIGLVSWIREYGDDIVYRLTVALRGHRLTEFHVFRQTFPLYRFVDLFRAVTRYCERTANVEMIESEHGEDLNSILNAQFYTADRRAIRVPTMILKDTAYGEQSFFPKDRFWVTRRTRRDEPGIPFILRVMIDEYRGMLTVELAALDSTWAEATMKEIVKDSIAHSIYRNRLLQVTFDKSLKDESGDVPEVGPFLIEFKQEKPVTKADIVLDPDIEAIVRRNVFDFLARRDELGRHGIPGRKGLLFYGPPGTGKTFTCKYVYSNLKGITTIIATGQALLHIKELCSLARLLQPCLLVLEDVDLVFASREINLYSSSLGDLLDEMDGFQAEESVIFLLTTNAIERLEQAIKERPGRINQCIYFGYPTGELRKLYIERYLQQYDASKIDLVKLVDLTKGASQAFIRELVFRSAQFAMEDSARPSQPLPLTDRDFQSAFDEMTKYNEASTRSIIGFKGDS